MHKKTKTPGPEGGWSKGSLLNRYEQISKDSQEEQSKTNNRRKKEYPSEFANKQIEAWRRQFASRTLSNKQRRLFSYFGKVQGREDRSLRKNRLASPHLNYKKGVF